jgi:hypothetical protein
MAGEYINWEEIKRKHGDLIPSKDRDAFFEWARMNIPQGLPVSAGFNTKVTQDNVKKYYNHWQSLPEGQRHPIGEFPEPVTSEIVGPVSPLTSILQGQETVYSPQEWAYIQQYLNWAKSDMDSLVAGGELSEEEAGTVFSELSSEVYQRGLHSGLEGIKDSGIWDKWTQELYLNSSEVILPNGEKVYELGGFYYMPDYTHIPHEEQERIKKELGQLQELAEQTVDAQWKALGAEEKQKKALQSYFDLMEKWASPEMQAHRSILMRGEPHGRASYDIIVAKDAEEARRMGYASYIPESRWNSPQVQAAVNSALIQSLNAASQRMNLFRMQKEGTTTVVGAGPGKPTGTGKTLTQPTKQEGFPVWEQIPPEERLAPVGYGTPEMGVAMGTAPSFWDKLSKQLTSSEWDVVKQTARKAGLAAAGGEQAAGIVVRDERSPLGPLVMSPEEWLASPQRKHRADLADAMSTAAIKRKRELEESYRKYVMPEGVTSEWGQREIKNRTDIPTEAYVLKGETTPAWMTQYVPGLKAGEPLRLGHYFPAFSAQQWLAIPESHKSYLQSYVEASRQVLGPKIPLKPWEDMTQQMRTGLPYSQVPSTRFRRAIQRV